MLGIPVISGVWLSGAGGGAPTPTGIPPLWCTPVILDLHVKPVQLNLYVQPVQCKLTEPISLDLYVKHSEVDMYVRPSQVECDPK